MRKSIILVNFYIYGKSEQRSGGNNKPAILSDSVEALISAIYMDSGIEQAEKFILDNLKEAIQTASKSVGMKDYKTVLQEKLQKKGSVLIEYNVIEETGPDHDKQFVVEVKCNGKKLATRTRHHKKSSRNGSGKTCLAAKKCSQITKIVKKCKKDIDFINKM